MKAMLSSVNRVCTSSILKSSAIGPPRQSFGAGLSPMVPVGTLVARSSRSHT